MKVKVYDTYRKREVIISNDRFEQIKKNKSLSNLYKYIEYVPENFDNKELNDLDKIKKNTEGSGTFNTNIDIFDTNKEEELAQIKEKHKEEVINIISNASGFTKEDIISLSKNEESSKNINEETISNNTRQSKKNKQENL